MRTTASTHTGGALFEVGAMAAGYKPIWGVEIRPDIAAVAERNIPGLSVIRADVATVDWSSLERPYHFHSSPSCKNASQANVEAGEVEEDLSSARAICEALRVLQPPTFSLENVWGYRHFESFKLIVRTLRELGYCVDWWHLNAADYGTPQTRKRLILIAAKDFQPKRPQPTHSKTPDMFGVYKPWVGWLEAIAGLVDELPESEFADWQLKRLPEELKTMLLAQGGYDGNVVNRSIDEPSFTVTSNSNQSGVRALLVSSIDCTTREGEQPANTVVSVGDGHSVAPRAFLTSDNYASPNTVGERKLQLYKPTDPAMTVRGQAKTTMKAFLIPGDNASNGVVRQESEPMVTIQSRGLGQCPHRAYTGRVVKLTPRALARLQSVPDWYHLPDANGLACEIIGNGVACKLAQAIMESIR